jgi:hypothetical protein
MNRFYAFWVVLVLVGVAREAQPSQDKTDAQQVSPYSITVLTMEGEPHPFFVFGHNALWIRDHRLNRDEVYNWGTFRFDSITLIPEFFLGRFQYWVSVGSLYSTVYTYRAANRTIWTQELNLSPEQKQQIVERVRLNAKDENKYYKYDYYYDNCSTRIRDVIDDVCGGCIQKASMQKADMTFRQHTMRLTQSLLYEYVVLDLVMGQRIDQPITQWEEAFLPLYLKRMLSEARIEHNGVLKPLVKNEKIIFQSTRPPEPDQPPFMLMWYLMWGLLLGGGAFLLAWLSSKHTGARIAFGVLIVLVGLVVGFFGFFMPPLMLFTDHKVAGLNENIMQVPFWVIALTVFGVGIARGKLRSFNRARFLLRATVIFSLLGLCLKILPWFDQQNWRVIAFCIPMWLGLFFGLKNQPTISRSEKK